MGCTGCGKIKNIATGFANMIIKREEVEVVAEPRLLVCSNCEQVRLVGKIGKKGIYQCRECSCIVNAKTRVLSEHCPLNKW